MTTITTKPVHQWQWLPQAATTLLIGWMLTLVAASVSAAGVSTDASPEGPAQTAYAPASERGPVIIVISGHAGPASDRDYTSEIARLGYYAVLLDGKDILPLAQARAQDGAANLRKAIDRAQRSPHAVPGKTAVIGFSQGGGGALAHASNMPDLVSVVVAYYPTISWTKNPGSLVNRFRVPILVLAGERDQNACCPIESMRAMEVAAKESGAKFELVVYPQADHGFNRKGRAYRRDDDRDAWRRTTEMLRLHHPLR